MSKVINSYTKHDRVGALLQGMFKAVLIESDEQLIHVSRYIHLNPISSYLIKNLNQYEWSSCNEYCNSSPGFCSKEEILSHFKNPQDYQQFILDQAGYAQEINFIKHQVIEEF